VPAGGGDWELEWSIGGAQGAKFTRDAPFEFEGLSFAGPYSICPPGTVELCRGLGLTDVVYGLESAFTATGTLGLDVRRRLSDSLSFGLGVLGGAALRNERLIRGTNGRVDPVAPPEPDDLFDASQDFRNVNGRTNGVGFTAYAGAGFRFEKGFESRTAVGYRPSSIRILVDAGGGFFPLLPGKDEAGLGTPAGIHLGAGVRIRRGSGRALTVSLFHVRALADTDHLTGARLSWTGVRVGWVSER
jgi:hypothetical protein